MSRPFGRLSGSPKGRGEEDFEKPYRWDKDYLLVEGLFSWLLIAAMPTG